MVFNPNVSFIPEEESTPRVVALLEIIQLQKEQIQALRDEIARLKGHKPKPEVKPSQMEKNSESKEKKSGRPGSTKRKKTGEMEIHDTVVLQAENIPEGSTFKGYENYTVQGLIFKSHNILYRRERWQTPDGKSIVAPLPHDVQTLDGGHFNGDLISYVIFQYHHAHVTQPLILEELLEIGIDISSGQINRIITENHDRFHHEKDEILDAGLKVSGHLNVDDTSARHQGKNGYCTHIGNELFAWFQSTASKSRINFYSAKIKCAFWGGLCSEKVTILFKACRGGFFFPSSAVGLVGENKADGEGRFELEGL